MTDRELVVFLQQQNTKLLTTLESLTKEVSALKAALLEKDKGAEDLRRLANNISKKTEKRKNTASVTKATPKERGSNRTKK